MSKNFHRPPDLPKSPAAKSCLLARQPAETAAAEPCEREEKHRLMVVNGEVENHWRPVFTCRNNGLPDSTWRSDHLGNTLLSRHVRIPMSYFCEIGVPLGGRLQLPLTWDHGFLFESNLVVLSRLPIGHTHTAPRSNLSTYTLFNDFRLVYSKSSPRL